MSARSSLHVRSINHKTAPTEVREQAHLTPEQAVALMDALDEGLGADSHDPATAPTGCVSVIPVSTCNRTEIYMEVREGFDPDEVLRQGLASVGRDPGLFLGSHALKLDGGEAVAHLFRLAAGMESMMLGEPQITAQLKDAYRLAREHREPGPGLLRAFQGAFRAGKRVRTETRISAGAVSVAFAAVELARKFFDKLCSQTAVLVGAGETGALAARHFLQHNIGHLVVVNRSHDRARDLAATLTHEQETARAKRVNRYRREFLGGVLAPDPDPDGRCGQVSSRPWEDMTAALAEADVILSTTGATEPVILPDMVREATTHRRGKPLFILDIAVPRDVHPDVAGIGGVFLFGLEDLDEIVQGNMAARRAQLPHAERIIQEELDEFQHWLDDMDLRPTVAEFRAYLEELKEKQVGFVRKKQSDEVAAEVEKSLQQFIKKVLGRSVSTLKHASTPEERERDLATLRRIFSTEDHD